MSYLLKYPRRARPTKIWMICTNTKTNVNTNTETAATAQYQFRLFDFHNFDNEANMMMVSILLMVSVADCNIL